LVIEKTVIFFLQFTNKYNDLTKYDKNNYVLNIIYLGKFRTFGAVVTLFNSRKMMK